MFSSMSQSFCVMPTKASMLRASADLYNDGNALLNCRETMLKSNTSVISIVRFIAVLLEMLILQLTERPL